MSNFNGRIGGYTPTLSFLDGPLGGGYAAYHQSSGDLQVGQSFSMGDVQWGRV